MQSNERNVRPETWHDSIDPHNPTPNLMENDHAMDAVKLPVVMRIYGILCLVGGALFLPVMILSSYTAWAQFQSGQLNSLYTTTLVIVLLMELCLTAMAALFLALGIRLLNNRRRYAAALAEILGALSFASAVFDIMLYGMRGKSLGFLLVTAALSFVLSSYFDPSLTEERNLRRKLRAMENRDRADEGTLGRDETGKGYITLNFFNMFWIFMIGCVFGVVFETLWHMLLVDFGVYQDRAGLIYGPFSPIYGFGALLMTIALNRFHSRSTFVIFIVSALIGGSFEYFVSWFMETAFGAVAWDYTGTFLNINGRTNFMFMCIWGLLGVAWIKVGLPWALRAVNLIPWNLRYTATTVCAALMMANGIMTLQALDCWYERSAGRQPATPIEEFYAENFDNSFMEHRFQTITIHPEQAVRP